MFLSVRYVDVNRKAVSMYDTKSADVTASYYRTLEEFSLKMPAPARF